MTATETMRASTAWLITLAETLGDPLIVRDIVDELRYRGVHMASTGEWYRR